jgi:hypothetical protein
MLNPAPWQNNSITVRFIAEFFSIENYLDDQNNGVRYSQETVFTRGDFSKAIPFTWDNYLNVVL